MATLRSWVGVAVMPVALAACSTDGGGGDDTPSPLCLSELMYHPVLEASFEDDHEFVEVHNPTAEAVSLRGYRLTGEIEFAFPADATIPAGGYVVVAKRRDALLAVSAYALDPAMVFGDFTGSLDDGGGTIDLTPPRGQPESVTYDDEPPWPVAADALGAAEAWLPPVWLPLETHRFRGVSLERVSCALPPGEVTSWTPSPLDGATPGRPNAGAAEAAPPIAVQVQVAPTPLTPLDATTVTVQVAPSAGLAAVSLEYFLDELTTTAEVPTAVPMAPLGGDRFTATVPAQSANSIIRYRVLLDGAPLSPRPSDPYRWHAVFVEPELATTTRTYHVFIDPSAWTELWDNIEGGRTAGCELSPTWDAEVPAVLAHDGRVYDVQLRYQGSLYNRLNGNELDGFSAPGPARPDPLRALSWHVKFPRYARLEGARKLTLNKLGQSCPGFTSSVGYELFRRAGVPGPTTRFVRLQVNGAYYHFTQELGAIDEDLIAADQEGTEEPLGHLFKSAGTIGDEGLLGWGDGRLLPELCGQTSAARYAAVYERKTWDWATHDDLIALLEGLNAARAAGDAALRTYVSEHFDVERSLTYIAVINWLGAWDDMFQNYYLYQRRSDGRWSLLPWDLDFTAGSWLTADVSVFLGLEGDPDNREGYWNYFKDALLRTHRAEYLARLRDLNASLLKPAVIEPLLDATLAELDQTEALSAPAGIDCDIDQKRAEYSDFAAARNAFVGAYSE